MIYCGIYPLLIIFRLERADHERKWFDNKWVVCEKNLNENIDFTKSGNDLKDVTMTLTYCVFQFNSYQ